MGTPKLQNPQTNLLKTHKQSAATKNQKPIPNKPAETQTSLFRHPQNLSILFILRCRQSWEICFSSMAVARWWQKPTNNPRNQKKKKKPNKSKSNNGKKKAQEKESEEKLTVTITTEFDGFVCRVRGGFDLGIGYCDVKWCYISDTLSFCSADLAKKKTHQHATCHLTAQTNWGWGFANGTKLRV